ncbi:MAG: mechanosensitive ion channel [Prevotella sp.]|nr:mechanosensitive ion channel [Prevotella sp.]
MEKIGIWVQDILSWMGLSGSMMMIVAHILMVLIAVAAAWLSYSVCRRVLIPVVRKLTMKTEVSWDEVLLNEQVLKSACQIVPAIVIWDVLPMVFNQFPLVQTLLERATAIYITVMATRTVIVFINSFKALEGERRTSTQQYFHSFCGVLKIVMIFIAGIVVVSIVLNKSPMTLFAGLGATSAILMLVFKDTIEGLVAGIRLTSNEMVHKGDWITVDSANADGIVEEMSLTTVKIRNFNNTISTVSPQTLINGSFKNWIGMQESEGRRVTRKLYFDYRSIRLADEEMKKYLTTKKYCGKEELEGDHVNLTLYRAYIDKALAKRPEVNSDMMLMVREFEPTPNGLPVEFYFFLKSKEWKTYEMQAAEIMEWAIAVAPEFGLKVYQNLTEK